MSFLTTVPPIFYTVPLGNKVVKILCTNEGYLSLSWATIGSKFEEIKTEGAPKNRDLFSCCACDKDSFFITGGSGPEVFGFEVWHFSLLTNKWTEFKCINQPPSFRKLHTSLFYKTGSGQHIYIFGGADLLCMKKDVAMCLKLSKKNDNTYKWFSYETIGDFKVPRASTSAMFAANRLNIFGGIDSEGNTLCDYYSFSIPLIGEKPNCTAKKELKGFERHSHIMDYIDGHVIIAGGKNGNDEPINNIINGTGAGAARGVFSTTYPIQFVEGKLVEVSDTVKVLDEVPLYPSLGPIFDELKTREMTYMKSITMLNDEKKNQIQEDGQYNEEEIRKINKRLINDNIKILRKAANIKVPKPRPNKKVMQMISNYLTTELSMCMNASEKENEEMKAEIEIANASINALKGTKEFDFDINDFDGFLESIKDYDTYTKSKLLDEFSSRQILEISRLKEEDEEIEATINSKQSSDILSEISLVASKAVKGLSVTKRNEEVWNETKNYLSRSHRMATQFQNLQDNIRTTSRDQVKMAKEDLNREYQKLFQKSDKLEELYKTLYTMRHEIKEIDHDAILEAAPTVFALTDSLFE